jgi:hypothetical protein
MATFRVLATAALVIVLAAPSAGAQTQRLRGEIQRVEGSLVFARGRDGGAITLKLTDNPSITAVTRAGLADIRRGDTFGSGAFPQPDGSQKAIEVHIFAASMRDQKGHRVWDGASNLAMTHDAGDIVTGIDGPILLVRYRDGEKKIIIGPTIPIVRYEVGSAADIRAGAAFSVVAATRQPDGTYTAPRINVWRDGSVPNSRATAAKE